jgi:hypothetical protein
MTHQEILLTAFPDSRVHKINLPEEVPYKMTVPLNGIKFQVLVTDIGDPVFYGVELLGLAPAKTQHKEADLDAEWDEFKPAWWEAFEGVAITAKDILDIAKRKRMLINVREDGSDISQAQKIGRRIKNQIDRDDVELSIVMDAKRQVQKYKLVSNVE